MLRKFIIRGSACAFPPSVLKSDEIDRRFGLKPGSTFRNSGVATRYRHERLKTTVASLGAEAIRQALIKAKMNISDIDLIVAAGATPDQLIPTNSVHIHRELNAPNHIHCFDLDSTCLSFISALDMVCDSLATGSKRRVIIVNSELGGSGIDPNHYESQCLFGDAATCFILESTEDAGIRFLGAQLSTFSDEKELCQLVGGGSRHPAFLKN